MRLSSILIVTLMKSLLSENLKYMQNEKPGEQQAIFFFAVGNLSTAILRNKSFLLILAGS